MRVKRLFEDKTPNKQNGLDDLTPNEEKVVDRVKDELEVADENVISLEEGDIEQALNQALKVAIRGRKTGSTNYPNVLFIGEAGSGKTSRIVAWAKRNNINLMHKQASVMDETDLGGAVAANADRSAVIKLTTTEFDQLDTTPNSILFLDELNRAARTVRGTLLTLIQDHRIPDPRSPGGSRVLKNFLFTIAAINPADRAHQADTLNIAEKSRFSNVYVKSDKNVTRKYLIKELTRQRDKYEQDYPDDPELAEVIGTYNGQIELADKILGSDSFYFDGEEDIEKSSENGNDLPLNARTFTNCLINSNGLKDDFLKQWDRYCNSTRKPDIILILKNYKDNDDVANAVLRKNVGKAQARFKGAVSGLSQAEKNDLEKLMDAMDNL